MAHRSDVVQVHMEFPKNEVTEGVVDPCCGMKMNRSEAKSVIFESEKRIYFCSRECREKYYADQHPRIFRSAA